MGVVKEATAKIGSLYMKFQKLMKLLSGPIGKVILFLGKYILIGLLIYIVVSVILKDIAKLLGINNVAQTNSFEEYMQQLTESGYDVMLDANELAEFYAFKYAILMDAARFMEETGTLTLSQANQSTVKFEGMSPEELALRIALGNQLDEESAFTQYAEQLNIPTTPNSNDVNQGNNNQDDANQGENDESSEEPEYTTAFTEENLFYYPIYNEYTKERALYPYLFVNRRWNDFLYYIEVTDPTAMANRAVDITNFGQAFRFQGGVYQNGASVTDAYNYILNNVRHATFCRELNVNNMGALTSSDHSYDDAAGDVDLYKEYSQSLYYSTTDRSSTYKIPLEVLLERFLPNATLMSSWKILSEDDSEMNGDDVVDEIIKIYSEACLEGEESSDKMLLVKDVNKISSNINAETNAKDLLNRTTIRQTLQDEYLYGGKTNQLYGAYEALYDSRVLDPGRQSEEPQEPSQSDDSSDDDATGIGFTYEQKFEGGFSGDLIDDIALAIKHYAAEYKVSITENMYNYILEDARKIIKPTESKTTSDDQYIIYTPLSSGKYLVHCYPLNNGDPDLAKEHFGLRPEQNIGELYGSESFDIIKPHIHENNPYANGATTECFVPFLKVAFTLENGLRKTSVIICHNNKYYGYLIQGREVAELLAITNNKTFVEFEVADVQSTIFSEWVYATDSSMAKENWVIEDAFEGMAIGLGEVTMSVRFKINDDPTEYRISITKTFEEWCKYFGMSITEADIASKILGKNVPTDAIFASGSDAIVRTPTDPTSRNYDGLLTPPSNASPDANYAGYANTCTTTSENGETAKTTKTYINLKKAGIQPGTLIDVSPSAVDGLESYIDSKISNTQFKNMIRNRYKVNEGEEPTNSIAIYPDDEINIVSTSVSINEFNPEFSAIFPTRQIISLITQKIVDKEMNFYMAKKAITWSGVKNFNNYIVSYGKFDNRENPAYIISNNFQASGLYSYSSSANYEWRTKMFAPVFAGSDAEKTATRETDVLLLLDRWGEASNEGIHAADYYIRDLYALINYSKGIKASTGDGIQGGGYDIKPVYKGDGKTPYVNYGSYTYLYIPDEILTFDETTAEEAFWLDRLISTLDGDEIDETTENYMRSKKPTFTWQIVDYMLYEECLNEEDGSAKVYALWPFGDQLSRSLYVFASNTTQDENDKVMTHDDNGELSSNTEIGGYPGWGGYSVVHEAADLYGRSMATKIYDEVFKPDGTAIIQAKYSNGEVTLENTLDTAGKGLYDNNTNGDPENFVRIRLGKKDYEFKSSAAAVYGYELYRLTLVLKSPSKAEKNIKERLEEEMLWTELRAVAPGIVTIVRGNATGGFGLKIEHGDGSSTSYSHMKRYPLVQSGDYVGAGTLLGYEGTTGKSKGFHLHMSVTKQGMTYLDPVSCMYPMFAPFYYAEKAEEVDYNLDSDYMTLTRTVFPYGQYSGVVENNLWSTEIDEKGMVEIKNYVPVIPLVDDSRDLLDETSEKYKDYSKLPVTGVRTGLMGSDYNESKLETVPLYFDEEFIEAVAYNGHKIKGVKRVPATTPSATPSTPATPATPTTPAGE